MIKFNKQKFIIAFVCTIIGWGTGFWMGKKRAEENFSKRNRNFGISQFFGIPFPDNTTDEEPPNLVERFLKKWDKENNQNKDNDNDDDFFNPHGDSVIDKPLSLFGLKNAQPKISTREDDKFVYMEIDLNSLDKNSIHTKVENETVTIEGDQKSEEGGSSISSHFYQSFPVPGDTDSSKVDMIQENNKLILKFPKIQR